MLEHSQVQTRVRLRLSLSSYTLGSWCFEVAVLLALLHPERSAHHVDSHALPKNVQTLDAASVQHGKSYSKRDWGVRAASSISAHVSLIPACLERYEHSKRA